ncbi:hypothetical protein GQ607_011777 [Colletotrichum asianum]|nr:hypothetical protein GQ607_017601 [Colletotrichum asianum]KAF0321019.1 hypothetical protein GQ607_011777 [Colletotrichum asianum]
MLIPSFY